MKSNQGPFKPLNPKKYAGNPNNIVYRSFLEFKLFRWLDKREDVLTWASEEFFIPYVSPVDNQVHRYFPDVLVKIRGKEGPRVILVEVKPARQTKPPKQPKKLTKTFITESKTWAVNQAKWAAAEEYCKKRGWRFQIITEADLHVDYAKSAT